MAIIESWMPPSREHWDLLLWLWQLYPIVRFQALGHSNWLLTLVSIVIVSISSMASDLVPHGQNLYRLTVQHSWENCLDLDGASRRADTPVPHVCPPRPEQNINPSHGQLAHGRSFCKSSSSAFATCSLLISFFFPFLKHRLPITSTEPSLDLSSTLPCRPYIPSCSSSPLYFSFSTPPV